MKFITRAVLLCTLTLLATIAPAQIDTITSGAQVFRVAPDGSGDHPTIEAALAAASDPNVDKIIELAAGTYNYPMDRHTRLQVTTPRTHIRGAGPDATKIVASSGKGRNSWGVLEIRAPQCTVDGIWVENRWKKGDIPNKQTALAVGTQEDPTLEPDALTTMTGIRISNSKFTGTTKDRHSQDYAWDVVTIGANVTDCVFTNCEMVGFADVFSSWAQYVLVEDCDIIAKGWNAIWVTAGRKSYGFSQEGVSVFRNCRLANTHYYIAGGATDDHPGMPVVYLDQCVSANEDGSIPEAARMMGSTALHVVIDGTPFLPFKSVRGGPKGIPPTAITSGAAYGRKQTTAIPGRSLHPGEIATHAVQFPGVRPGDMVAITPAADPDTSGSLMWNGYVTAPGTVEVRFSAGAEGAVLTGDLPVNIAVKRF